MLCCEHSGILSAATRSLPFKARTSGFAHRWKVFTFRRVARLLRPAAPRYRGFALVRDPLSVGLESSKPTLRRTIHLRESQISAAHANDASKDAGVGAH